MILFSSESSPASFGGHGLQPEVDRCAIDVDFPVEHLVRTLPIDIAFPGADNHRCDAVADVVAKRARCP